MTKTRSLTYLLNRAVFRSVLILGMFVAAYLFTANSGVALLPDAGAGKPLAVGSPAYLIEKHECWTGSAPRDMAGKVPGHVVYIEAGMPHYGGKKMVALGLDVIFGDAKSEVESWVAFCR